MNARNVEAINILVTNNMIGRDGRRGCAGQTLVALNITDTQNMWAN